MNKKDVFILITKLFISIASILLAFGIFFCIIIYSVQDKILFYPRHDKDSYNDLIRKDSFEEVKIKDKDLELHGWIKYNSDKEVAPIVIYFGGNAQNSSNTFNYFDEEKLFNYFEGYHVLYVDYPGYGLSLGKPSGDKLLEAGLSIYDYAYNLDCVDKENINILGFSIGTGVATYVSSLKNVNGLILLAPYDELLSMYNDTLNIFYGPFRLLVRHNIMTYKYADDVNVKPLVIITKDDQVINYEHSVNLVKYFKETEDVIITEGFGHNDFLSQEIVLDNIYSYLQKRLDT